MTALLALLTVTLALASLTGIARSIRPLVLFFVFHYPEAAGEAYERSAAAAGMVAATLLCAGLWEAGVPVAAGAAALGVLWRRERDHGEPSCR